MTEVEPRLGVTGIKAAQGEIGTEGRRRTFAPSEYFAAVTDVGRVRKHNEDTFYVSCDGRVLIAADGMGGHAAGEIASALASEAIVKYFSRRQKPEYGCAPTSPENMLLDAFHEAHNIVLTMGKNHPECRGMGTTLIVAYMQADWLYTCHVGDVRGYVLTASGLERLTKDHSLVEELVQAGQITPGEARHHPNKNIILQAIGLDGGINPETTSRRMLAGERLLLCSDGLWEALTDEEISAITAKKGPIVLQATELIDEAINASGHDNITVVLYEHTNQGELGFGAR